jgi:hypothetical protein
MKFTKFLFLVSMLFILPEGTLPAKCTQGDCLKGKGAYTWKDGSLYKGEWKNSMRHGFGTYTWPGGKKYQGHWQQNVQSGKGKMLWANGDTYDGDWLAGKMSGWGTYIYKNKNRYSGEFLNNLPHGKGVLYDHLGLVVYEGNWENGKPLNK